MKEPEDFLTNVYLFNGIDKKHLQVVFNNMIVQHYEDGEEIIREGDKGDSLFVLLEGEVMVSKKMSLINESRGVNKVEKSLIRLKDTNFAFFGEMALCGGTEERSASVTAITACKLGELKAGFINEHISNHPEFGSAFFRNLATVLAERLRKSNKDILKLTTALTLALEE